MTRTRTTYSFLAVIAAIAALAVAGCGSSSSSSEPAAGSETSSAPASEESAGGGTAISAASISGLGKVLVNPEGLTVYEFKPDKSGTSTCYEECEEAWPPVVAKGSPTAGEGATSSDLGTTKRKDGTMQVTYKGRPLYTFAGDKAPGEANGNEDEGVWFALNGSGEAVKGHAEKSSSPGGHTY